MKEYRILKYINENKLEKISIHNSETKKIRQVVILAAGMGKRLRPLTLTTPKSLVEVNGRPVLEKRIEYLNEIGIYEIIVVTGYLNEKFEYLKEKYWVKLIYNDYILCI